MQPSRLVAGEVRQEACLNPRKWADRLQAARLAQLRHGSFRDLTEPADC
jgi:hypothetical protein